MKFKAFENPLLHAGCLLGILLLGLWSGAQVKYPAPAGKVSDSLPSGSAVAFRDQLDLIDLAYRILHKDPASRVDSTGTHNTRLYFSVAPIVEYTTATGFSPGVASNVAFLTSIREPTNTSNILGAVKYTQKHQFLLPIQSSLWAPGNRFNFVGDWRYLNYPQDTYGFGGHTQLTDKYIVSFQYVRLYEYVLKNIGRNFYAGLGYLLDRHWNIRELEVAPGRVTDFVKYGYQPSSTSSGIALVLQYDSRGNAINPRPGSFFANFQLVQDATFLGASTGWTGMLLDVRKFFKAPFHSVFGLWLYSVWNLAGDPPYLDLPATGSDTYNNTGRGYEQNRFVGKRMVDLEGEYRFPISRNGLIGGVVFCNAETLSELGSNRLSVISPGFGLGLRFKFNKFSATNACLDYGIGTHGSRGFSGNLGEVF
jgi:hypothetical protein